MKMLCMAWWFLMFRIYVCAHTVAGGGSNSDVTVITPYADHTIFNGSRDVILRLMATSPYPRFRTAHLLEASGSLKWYNTWDFVLDFVLSPISHSAVVGSQWKLEMIERQSFFPRLRCSSISRLRSAHCWKLLEAWIDRTTETIFFDMPSILRSALVGSFWELEMIEHHGFFVRVVSRPGNLPRARPLFGIKSVSVDMATLRRIFWTRGPGRSTIIANSWKCYITYSRHRALLATNFCRTPVSYSAKKVWAVLSWKATTEKNAALKNLANQCDLHWGHIVQLHI